MRDWFQAVKINFETLFLPMAGRPLAYLEVGVCRGVSLSWMLEHVLTHLDSRAVGVDVWDTGGIRRRGWVAGQWYTDAMAAIAPYGKATLVKANSHDYLQTIPSESFDIAYIDGDHLYSGVMQDSCEAWRIVREGGIIGWDDYNIGAGRARSGRPAVMEAVNDFLANMGGRVEVLLEHKRQRWVRKVR